MSPSEMALQGLVWARAARRRFESAGAPASSLIDGADRNADLAQGIEAMDHAFRYVDQVLHLVSGTVLPPGTDWAQIRKFVRRGRDAAAHGDDRLSQPGYGYYITLKAGHVEQFGKARSERAWRTDVISWSYLLDASERLEAWLLREASI